MRARDFLTGVKALLTYVTSIYHFEHKAGGVGWLLVAMQPPHHCLLSTGALSPSPATCHLPPHNMSQYTPH